MTATKLMLICAFVVCTGVGIWFFSSKESTYQFEPIESLTQLACQINCDQNTIVFFDVDDTILKLDTIDFGNEPLLFKALVVIKHPMLLWPKSWEHYMSIMYSQAHAIIIEPFVVDIIKQLKQSGCTVLACTSMESGPYGVIKSFPEWRYAALKDFNIEFSQTYPDAVFNTLPAYRNNYPLLYKGILCCNQQPKGNVVQAFLNHFKLAPSRIIFIDDSISSLASVAHICAQRKIPFKGYCYVGAAKRTKPRSWKARLSQLDYLMSYEQWRTT